MGCSSDRAFGQPYGANVVLPKQLLLEAVQDVVKKGTASGVADREDVLRRLEGVLSEGYEGVGWTIFQAGPQAGPAGSRDPGARPGGVHQRAGSADLRGRADVFHHARNHARVCAAADPGELLGYGRGALGIVFAVPERDHEDGPADRNVVGRGAGERELSWQDYDAGASGAGAGRRPEYGERVFEPSQRRPLVPEYVAAGDGGGGSARRDGADGVSRGCGRHRGRIAGREGRRAWRASRWESCCSDAEHSQGFARAADPAG